MGNHILSMKSSATLLATSGKQQQGIGEVCGLFRHSVKGLSADDLNQVVLQNAGETFPDDRRFALMKSSKLEKFNEESPKWLHKENFLCVFTAPALMAKYKVSYEILRNESDDNDENSSFSYALPCDKTIKSGEHEQQVRRILKVYERASNTIMLGPVDLAQKSGREELASFFSKESGESLVCVAAADVATNDISDKEHLHQFGNTGSGWKLQKDTRTLHIVNAATVRALSEKIGISLSPQRFRPNIVIDGPKAWSEFDWVDGEKLKFLGGHEDDSNGMTLKVIKKTVRCDGISVDPENPDSVLDIPALLNKHFPEYGPYLGVYAVVDEAGAVCVGDNFKLL